MVLESGSITGFKDFGDTPINTTTSQVLDVEEVSSSPENHQTSNSSLIEVNSTPNGVLAGSKYSDAWDRYGYL